MKRVIKLRASDILDLIQGVPRGVFAVVIETI